MDEEEGEEEEQKMKLWGAYFLGDYAAYALERRKCRPDDSGPMTRALKSPSKIIMLHNLSRARPSQDNLAWKTGRGGVKMVTANGAEGA